MIDVTPVTIQFCRAKVTKRRVFDPFTVTALR